MDEFSVNKRLSLHHRLGGTSTGVLPRGGAARGPARSAEAREVATARLDQSSWRAREHRQLGHAATGPRGLSRQGPSGPCRLFIVRPHANDFDRPDVLKHLIDEAVLDIDASRIGAGQIADQFLIGRGRLKRILSEDCEERFRFGLEAGRGEFPGVLLRLPGKHHPPAYHRSLSLHCATGIFSPRRIDARIPGMERRCSVSCMACQSSSAISTALCLRPAICTGLCEVAV